MAAEARGRGLDPSTEVEIPQAEDLAARVEKQLSDWHVEGVAERIRGLSKRIESREEVSLYIAKELAKEAVAAHEGREMAIERAVRVGLSVLTEGILVAPIVGIAGVKINPNPDGTEYLSVFFNGPIRAAGGTAQAMSVLIADVVRREFGIGAYKPTTGEVERLKEEIPLYKQCQHLQYTPSNGRSRSSTGIARCAWTGRRRRTSRSPGSGTCPGSRPTPCAEAYALSSPRGYASRPPSWRST